MADDGVTSHGRSLSHGLAEGLSDPLVTLVEPRQIRQVVRARGGRCLFLSRLTSHHRSPISDCRASSLREPLRFTPPALGQEPVVSQGRRGRKIRLTARLKEALAKNQHLLGDRVLWRDDVAAHGMPLKVTQVLLAKWMCRAQRKAGLKVTGGIHILRHTFCSRLAMAGATPVAISTMAGHQSLSTTQRYLHLAPAAMDQAIALLDRGADLAASEPVAAVADNAEHLPGNGNLTATEGG